jgi:hypothetical protein
MTDIDTHDDAEDAFDLDAINEDIATGAKALTYLVQHKEDDWMRWSATIKGLRGLRDLAASKSGSRDLASWHYRQALGALLELKKHAVYGTLTKQQRSSCYKLMDRIEDIDIWYATISTEDKMRWKSPDAIAKHVPKNLLAGGGGHNRPKPKGKKKPASTANEERLRAILIAVIREFVMPANPQRGSELLAELYSDEADLNDDIADIGETEDAD